MDRVHHLVARLTSPKRVLSFAGASLTLLAFARVAVLVVESYSAVWNERDADHELVRLCNSGTAAMSNDFMSLCMKKRAERSAPVLLKALLRACGTAFADFCESFSSPTKLVLLILFCLTGVAAPVVKAVATLVVENLKRRRRSMARDSDDECSDDEKGHQEIVVVRPDGDINHGSQLVMGALGMRLRRSMRSIRAGRAPQVPLALANLQIDDNGIDW